MDDSDTIEDVVRRRCKCGGFLRVRRTDKGRKIEVICDSCNLKRQE